MKNTINFILSILLLLPIFSTASVITQGTAEQVAKNYYFEKTNIPAKSIQFENIFIKKVESETYYYVFNLVDSKGFIVVSAEDGFYPIIGYSQTGNFKSENQPANINWWMNQYIEQIKYIRDNNIQSSKEISDLWKKFNLPSESFSKTFISSKSVLPLVGDILWNQDNGWNDFCPEDAAGPGGNVYAGCVATAMGIIMKYWEYPIHGTGSHSYNCNPYGVQSANFANATYFWNNMNNTTSNFFSAILLYHLGVSVNMSYSPEGSGAYSFQVDDALEDYFQYSTDAQYVSRDGNYTESEWINMLKAEIDAGRPVYYSGRNNDDEGHAFVCSGYDDSNLFHYNFGWSGSNNGYYTVSNVGGFHVQQAAVINIHPLNSNSYPGAPNSLTCLLDNSDVNNFNVNIEWEAPVTKDVTSYLLYRNIEQIAELNSDVFSFNDTPEPGNYNYSIAAKYSTGEESLTVTDYLQGLFNVIFYAKDPTTGNNITTASVSFNNQVLPTTFIGASFSNVAFGGDYLFSISHPDYPTTSGYVDVTENMTINVVMDGSTTKIDNLINSEILLSPNPVADVLNLKISNNLNESSYEIINSTGNVIKKGIIKTEKIINTEELSSGYYILKITSGNKIFTKPFIKS